MSDDGVTCCWMAEALLLGLKVLPHLMMPISSPLSLSLFQGRFSPRLARCHVSAYSFLSVNVCDEYRDSHNSFLSRADDGQFSVALPQPAHFPTSFLFG